MTKSLKLSALRKASTATLDRHDDNSGLVSRVFRDRQLRQISEAVPMVKENLQPGPPKLGRQSTWYMVCASFFVA